MPGQSRSLLWSKLTGSAPLSTTIRTGTRFWRAPAFTCRDSLALFALSGRDWLGCRECRKRLSLWATVRTRCIAALNSRLVTHNIYSKAKRAHALPCVSRGELCLSSDWFLYEQVCCQQWLRDS